MSATDEDDDGNRFGPGVPYDDVYDEDGTLREPVDLDATVAELDRRQAAPARPTFTVSAAAEATGKSRRTIGRMLDAGELPGAHRDASGTWSIPAEALLAAGLQLHAPAPPDAPAERSTPQNASEAGAPVTREAAKRDDLDKLRIELADWRRRAEVAEAVAAERAAALNDVRAALALAQRMLTPGAPEPSSSADRDGTARRPAAVAPERAPAAAEDFPDQPTPRRGRLGRWRNRR